MDSPPSVFGRLIYEIAWDAGAKDYLKEGGRGYENVLTAEVFQALDYLPRAAFLGRVVRSAEGGASEALGLLADQIEQASISILPQDLVLAHNASTGKASYTVQPDGIIVTPDVYCLVEAKRIRRSGFQPDQLARELLAALQGAGQRLPLLLLVLPVPPPVSVRSHGRLEIHEAVANWLEPVLARADYDFPPLADIVNLIDSTVAFTTWSAVAECVTAALEEFDVGDSSARDSAGRIVAAICEAIKWHS